jgi:hypothetical protein
MKKFIFLLLLDLLILATAVCKVEAQAQGRAKLGLGSAAVQNSSYFLQTANNLSDVTAATARTNLGATTVGANIFTIGNPSAIRYFKINADNTVTLRTAAEMLGDLGAQASGSYVATTDIGSTVQAYDADLNTISGLTATTDNFLVSVSSAWASRTPAQVKTTLGLVPGTNIQAWDADLDTWSAVTPAAGVGSLLATPSSANLRTALTDENGTGALLFNGATAPDFTTGFTIGTAAASGKFIVGNGTNYVASTSTIPTSAGGTAGKILVSDGTNYVLSTPTFPNASATSRKMIVSDGTNWLASTETWAVPGVTAGTHLVGDGTNWTAVNERTNWTSFVVSGSNATTTGQSLVDVTGLVSGTLTNSTLYEVEAWLYVTTSNVTTGTEYGIGAGGSGGAAVVEALVTGTTTTNAGTTVTLSASATATAAFMTTSSSSGVIYIHGFVTTRGSGTANISIQHLKVTSGTSTVNIGSKMLIRLANGFELSYILLALFIGALFTYAEKLFKSNKTNNDEKTIFYCNTGI